MAATNNSGFVQKDSSLSEQFKSVINHLNTPFIFINITSDNKSPKLTLISCNNFFANLVSFDCIKHKGKTLDDIEGIECLARDWFSFFRSYIQGNKYLPEFIIINGVKVKISSYRPDEKNIIFFFNTDKDQTKNKIIGVDKGAEEIEAEKRYRKLFDMYADAVFLIDIDTGQILETNTAVEKIYQYNREESLKMKNTDFSAEPDSTRKALQSKLEKVLLRWHKKKDGTVFPVEITASNFEWNGRDVQIAVCRDISDRVQGEESLHKFERIFNLSPDLICISSIEGNFIKVNPAFQNILGYLPEEVEGKPFVDFIYKEDIDSTQKSIDDAVKNKLSLINIENRYICKDGSLVWFSWTSQMIFNEGIAFMVAHNITNLKEIEAELTLAKNKAEESDKLKSAFLANMSHEIRTPMNGIIGFSNLLKDETLPQDKREKYVETINASSNQLLAIISDIIDISKIESGLINLFYKEHNLNKILNELYEHFDLELEMRNKHHLNIIKSFALPDNQSNIVTDEVRIRQVYINLVTNAIKFTTHGSVTYGYYIEDKYLVLFVKDTGIGVSAKDQAIVFDRFRQAEEVQKRLTGGTGLGLSICKGIVELMHGDIWLESEEGKGTQFYVKIPYRVGGTKNETLQNQDKPFSQFDWSKYTILVVEDVENIRLFLSEVLFSTKATCLFAVKGKQAVEICNENDDIDLILMDVQLPDISGYEATKLIRRNRKNIPIIAQTAYAMAGDKEEALKAGCNNYISKPIKKEKLLGLISQYLK